MPPSLCTLKPKTTMKEEIKELFESQEPDTEQGLADIMSGLVLFCGFDRVKQSEVVIVLDELCAEGFLKESGKFWRKAE